MDFALNEDSEVPRDDERENGSSSGISEAGQLSEYRKTDRIKTFFFLVKREMPNLLSVKCETAILFNMKRDQYPPHPLYHFRKRMFSQDSH